MTRLLVFLCSAPFAAGAWCDGAILNGRPRGCSGRARVDQAAIWNEDAVSPKPPQVTKAEVMAQ